jgi:5-methylthioadenosine/S-adenosylhomocysteine deaminase
MNPSSTPVDILLEHATIVSMDGQRRIYQDSALAVLGSRIHWIGPQEQAAQFLPRQRLDLRGKVLIPGIVNTHGHWAMALYRGLVDDTPLEQWLDVFWKVEKRYNSPENVEAGAQLAIIEMLRSGTTCAADMYWQYRATTQAARGAGFRMINGPSFTEILGFEDQQNVTRAGASEYIETYRDDPLVHVCVQAHSTYTTNMDQLEFARRLAEDNHLLFITHASESRSEVETVRAKYGRSPIEVLDAAGLLNDHTLLAHCVHLSDAEIERLAATRTSVAHCPSSNLKLASGIARVADMLRAGVNVSIGTDGPASNNDLDMFEEMRLAALLQKGVTLDPTVLPAEKAFAMITIDGARAFGLADQIGSVEVGKVADLAVLDFSAPNLTPTYDLYSQLVYAASAANVVHTIVNGRVLMQDRCMLTLDEEAVKAKVNAVAAQVRAAA